MAYAKIDDAIQSVRSYFSRLESTSKAARWLNLRGLYRARIGQNTEFRRGDLFHIPFGEREKVGAQRYSIPGLPCLYLGSSAYLCWEELGRPNWETMHVARFEVLEERELRILTIGPSPQFIRRELSTIISQKLGESASRMYENAAVSIGVCWPLILACSLTVEKPDKPFVPEYIVPQLVLQWVTTTKGVDGIQYQSVSVDSSKSCANPYDELRLSCKI